MTLPTDVRIINLTDTADYHPIPYWLACDIFKRMGIPGSLPPGQYAYVLGCQQPGRGYWRAGVWGQFGLVGVEGERGAA